MAVTVTGSVDIRAMESVVLRAISDRLNVAVRAAAPRIRKRVGQAATDAIKVCPEYTSLLTDKLRGELGVVDAGPVLELVCANISRGSLVEVVRSRVSGSVVVGGVDIGILKGDYSEVLKVAGGAFVSEGGFEVDWLRWLTLEGDRILIGDYRYSTSFPEWSRTGTGVMIEGGSWRVPPEFSGTSSDNWLTRALVGIGPAVEAILVEEVQKGF